MSILSEIKFSYKEAKNQKNVFTARHTKFVCTIEYNNVGYTFDYQCNTKYSQPNLRNCIECLLSDASCYNDYSYNEFCREFGYDTHSEEAVRIYEECEDTAQALRTMFNDDEIEQIYEALNE